MLTLWGRKSSINVQKILWLLDELSLAYKHQAVGGEFGGLDQTTFLKMNPHGKIPVLQDGDLSVWESHAILRYLAARYGADRFWSDSPAVRSQVDEWVDWSQTAFQPEFMSGIFWGYYRTPEELRSWSAIKASIQHCANYISLLDTILTRRPYIAGESLSLADIALGSLMYRYFELDLGKPTAPAVEEWYKRLRARAAYQHNVMTPFVSLKGRLTY
jgi:glutathione S-transferase